MHSTFVFLVLFLWTATAFTQLDQSNQSTRSKSASVSLLARQNEHTPLEPQQSQRQLQQLQDRRSFCTSAVLTSMFLTTTLPSPSYAAAAKTDVLLQQLQESLELLKPIPNLLAANEWDKVRSILKSPPVNFLWNLGDSKNPVLALANVLDDIDLIDLKDELSISLQMCDQYTYDNNFIAFQPGNGKLKVKEPTEMANQAMKQLQQAIDMVQKGN